jgi:hypothetical protein
MDLQPSAPPKALPRRVRLVTIKNSVGASAGADFAVPKLMRDGGVAG